MLDTALTIAAARIFRDRFEGAEGGTENGALLDLRDSYTESGSLWANRPCVFIRSTPTPNYALARISAVKAANAAVWALARPIHATGLQAIVIEKPEKFSATPEYMVSEITPGIYGAWINVACCQDKSRYERVHQEANTAAAEWTTAAKGGAWELVKHRNNSGTPQPSYDTKALVRDDVENAVYALLTRKGIY